MKSKIVTLQLVLTLVVSLILYLFKFDEGFIYSVFVASFLSCVNLVALVWGFEQLFFKKSVALGAGVIVSKWLILVFVLYKLLQLPSISGGGVALGIGLFFPVLVVVGYIRHKESIVEE